MSELVLQLLSPILVGNDSQLSNQLDIIKIQYFQYFFPLQSGQKFIVVS